MALQAKISFISLDRSARILTIKDSTGSYSEDNPGGYGGSNPSNITKVVFRVGHINSSVFKDITQDAQDTNNLLPPLSSILAGETVSINSRVLGITTEGDGLDSFEDGVLQVDYFVHIGSSYPVTAEEGKNFILGGGLDALSSYDQIEIGAHVYNINKTISTNGGTVLHLLEFIKEAGTTASPVSRGNLKVLNTENTKNTISKSAGNLSGIFCEDEKHQQEREIIIDMKIWLDAAIVAFEAKDYKGASSILCSVRDYGLKFGCSC